MRKYVFSRKVGTIMRNGIKVTILIAYAAALAACGCASTGARGDHALDAEKPPGVPSIVFQTQSHDFGTVQYSTAGLTHAFVFENRGGAALMIKNIKSG